MCLLIAEIGNTHMGSIRLAKELIRVAHESGADIVKGQAFRAEDIKTGSMPRAFYERCALTEGQYVDLIDYARLIGTDLFYSIFSSGFDRLRSYQKWQKLSAAQSAAVSFGDEHDTDTSVVSFSRVMIESSRVPKLRNAWALYATEYMPDKKPDLSILGKLKTQVSGPIGLSDHTIGPRFCIQAVASHAVDCIEKHFTLQKDVYWGGQVFRDTIHGAIPFELSAIAKAMKPKEGT